MMILLKILQFRRRNQGLEKLYNCTLPICTLPIFNFYRNSRIYSGIFYFVPNSRIYFGYRYSQYPRVSTAMPEIVIFENDINVND